jgi:hypothetical protein
MSMLGYLALALLLLVLLPALYPSSKSTVVEDVDDDAKNEFHS